VKEKKNGDIAGWQVYEKAILGGLASVLENPMVQGITSAIDAGNEIVKDQKADKLGNIVKGVPASFIPTVLNQARTATDNSQRETYDKDYLTEVGNLMLNKMPGASKSLPVSNDSLGNPRKRIQDGESNTVGQYLKAFFSPAQMTEYKVSPEAKMVIDLMNESGDANVLPRIVDKYIKVKDPKTGKDTKVDLTPQQYSDLQGKVGKEVTKKLQQSAAYLANPSNKIDSKVKRVKDILSEVGTNAKKELGQGLGYQKKDVH
jgi:hypothetical protein